MHFFPLSLSAQYISPTLWFSVPSVYPEVYPPPLLGDWLPGVFYFLSNVSESFSTFFVLSFSITTSSPVTVDRSPPLGSS